MQTRDYSAIALALLEARGRPAHENYDSYRCGWVDGVNDAALFIADKLAEHDPTFDREDFLKLTRGE